MAGQVNTLFLEEWLRTSSGSAGSTSTTSQSSSSSARAIIQSWAELRDALQHLSFQPQHLQSLNILLNSRAALHVADPQAKLVLSILSSRNLNLPHESYPLLLRLLYLWVRKSFRPSAVIVDAAVEVLSNLLDTEYGSKKSPQLFSEVVLLLGAFAFVPSVSESTKTACLELLCRLLEQEYRLVSSSDALIPDVLAGIGYALCSSVNTHYVRMWDVLLGIWGKEDGLHGSISYGLMILHLVEWVISGFIKLNSQEKMQTFCELALESSKEFYVPFARVMAAAGVLRALSRSTPSSQGLQVVSLLRSSTENLMESVARDLISKTSSYSDVDRSTSLLLKCFSLALGRSGPMSSRATIVISLASALLTEVFPLRRFYRKILELVDGCSAGLLTVEVKAHVNSVPFKEAGSISRIFCNLYVPMDEENKAVVENMIWLFCQEVYSGHRQVAFLLRGREDELLGNIEKIAESAFLMVVFFALAVTKEKLNSKYSIETQIETSLSILVSFSCVEYFRRIRLPEYMDAIRGVVMSMQGNETACVSFVKSIPSYIDLTNPQGFLPKLEYVWFKDEVQTARILFFLKVVPTCIEYLPGSVFSRVAAPTMFLYMGHPNGKVARASHSVFAAFISSGKDSDENERSLFKEQLAFYYVERSLTGYPDTTPFEGMASGVVAVVRNLPAGCPATFYCIHSLIEKANTFCGDISTQELDIWKNWQGESGPCKKLLELLFRLLSLVDIQVLPDLMKLFAQLIIRLPKDGQDVVLNELYTLVAESDDVTRKPALVSWLQSLSYFCSQITKASAASEGNGLGNSASSVTNPSNWEKINARL